MFHSRISQAALARANGTGLRMAFGLAAGRLGSTNLSRFSIASNRCDPDERPFPSSDVRDLRRGHRRILCLSAWGLGASATTTKNGSYEFANVADGAAVQPSLSGPVGTLGQRGEDAQKKVAEKNSGM